MIDCLLAGTGAWESALTNTLSPGDKIVSFLIGQFSLLWIDQQQRLNFNVDVVESDWGYGADLAALDYKLRQDPSHSIKAICIVHNETATGVTNDLSAVRKILGNILSFLSLSCLLSLDELLMLIHGNDGRRYAQTSTGTRRYYWWTGCHRYVRWTSAWMSGEWTWR